MNTGSAMCRTTFFFFFFLLVSLAASFDVTSILSQFSDFSVFNGYLSQTNLVYAINSRKTITVLAVNNGAMSALSGLPQDSIKKLLSLHVILDYYDPDKLHQLSHKSTLLTTLLQTTGTATSQEGFLNVTVLNSGTIAFGSAVHGSSLSSNLVKSVAAEPYDISVLEISSVIIPPGFTDSSDSIAPVNITSTLLNSGFKAFAALLQFTGAMQTFQSSANGGITIFALKDQAITQVTTNLTSDEKASLVLYHAVAGYLPLEYLKKVAAPLGTLASNGNSKFQLKVSSNGQNVALNTGVNTVNIVKTVMDQQQVVVYLVDDVLQPPEIFSSKTSTAPTPVTTPAADAPAPARSKFSPPSPPPADDSESASPSAAPLASPPAPPADGPAADGPASSPGSEVHSHSKDASSAARLACGFGLAAVMGILYI